MLTRSPPRRIRLGPQAVGGLGDVIEHFLGGEDAGMNVGDEGDGEAVQPGRKTRHCQLVSLDAELSELGDADAAEGDAGEGRGGKRGGGEETSAGEERRRRRGR